MRWTPERLIDEVDLLGARGLPRKEFFTELAPRLRNVIDNDASCWHTLDPHTRLMTSDSPDELKEEVKTTLVHEVAHFFGIDDEYLEELGY